MSLDAYKVSDSSHQSVHVKGLIRSSLFNIRIYPAQAPTPLFRLTWGQVYNRSSSKGRPKFEGGDLQNTFCVFT